MRERKRVCVREGCLSIIPLKNWVVKLEINYWTSNTIGVTGAFRSVCETVYVSSLCRTERVQWHTLYNHQNLLFSLKRSWFSKFLEPIRALFGLKISPAALNSLSQAAECGVKPQWKVAYCRERLQYLNCITLASKVNLKLFGIFLGTGLFDCRKEIILLWRMGALSLILHNLVFQVTFDIVKAYGIEKQK